MPVLLETKFPESHTLERAERILPRDKPVRTENKILNILTPFLHFPESVIENSVNLPSKCNENENPTQVG